MNTPPKQEKFPRDRTGFLDRQKLALKNAMMRSRLHYKDIAYAVGVHGETVERWARGEGAMTGDAIEACEMYFLYLGDFQFFQDLYGELGAMRIKRARQIEAAARDVRQQAEMLRSESAVVGDEAIRTSEW